MRICRKSLAGGSGSSSDPKTANSGRVNPATIRIVPKMTRTVPESGPRLRLRTLVEQAFESAGHHPDEVAVDGEMLPVEKVRSTLPAAIRLI